VVSSVMPKTALYNASRLAKIILEYKQENNMIQLKFCFMFHLILFSIIHYSLQK
jgi:hypothetical protein